MKTLRDAEKSAHREKAPFDPGKSLKSQGEFPLSMTLVRDLRRSAGHLGDGGAERGSASATLWVGA